MPTQKELIETATTQLRELKAIEYVVRSFGTLRSKQLPLRNDWDKWDRLYNSEHVTQYYNGAANFFVGIIYECVETLVDGHMEILFPNGNLAYNIKGTEDADSGVAKLLKTTTDWQLQQMYFRKKIREAIRSALITGTLFCKLPWVTNDRTGYDNVDFVPLDLTQFYIDQYATSVNDTDICVQKTIVDINHLIAMKEKGVYRPGAVSMLRRMQTVDKDEEGAKPDEFVTERRKYEILEGYALWDINGDGYDEECLITVGNRKVLLRYDELKNIYKAKGRPFFSHSVIPQKNKIYGKGIPQICEDLQTELNDTRNQLSDNVTFILNNMWKVDRAGQVRKSQLKSRPFGIIDIDGINNVEPLRPPDVTRPGLTMEEVIKQDMYRRTGATPLMQSIPLQSRTTATETMRLANSGMRRLYSMVQDFEDSIIQPMLRRMYQYDLQFYTRNDFIRIAGKQGLKLDKAHQNDISIKGDWDFQPAGVMEAENKTTRLQQLINYYNIVIKNPRSKVNLDSLEERIWVSFGYTDYDEITEKTGTLFSPVDENTLMVHNGLKIEPSPFENQIKHLQVHMKAASNPLVAEHIIATQKLVQMQRMLLTQNAMQGAPGMPSQEQPVGAGAPGTPTPATQY